MRLDHSLVQFSDVVAFTLGPVYYIFLKAVCVHGSPFLYNTSPVDPFPPANVHEASTIVALAGSRNLAM